MGCSSCGKSRNPLQISTEKKAMALHGKKLVLPNGKTIQWQHDPNAKNKLKAVKLD